MGGNSSTARDTMASPVVISATVKQTATVIFLHGLGDTGHGWASTMATIRSPHVKFICPTAPTMPVTLNSGFQMPSWFDLTSLDDKGPEDADGIKKACQSVHQMIEQEITAGIPSDRIVVGGFSQGGALALYSGLSYTKPLAGIIALSCWLPLRNEFPSICSVNRDIPIFQGHGDCDPLVPYKWGQATTTMLRTFSPKAADLVVFKTYRGMMHSSCDEEISDMRQFLNKHLPSV